MIIDLTFIYTTQTILALSMVARFALTSLSLNSSQVSEAHVLFRQPYPGTLISTTNPLLLMTCKHWPHILRTGVGKNDGVGAGLISTRKRHIKKDAKVAKGVEAAFTRGDCESIEEGFLLPAGN